MYFTCIYAACLVDSYHASAAVFNVFILQEFDVVSPTLFEYTVYMNLKMKVVFSSWFLLEVSL